MCLYTAHCECRNKYKFLRLTIAILFLIFLFLQVILSARSYLKNLPRNKQTNRTLQSKSNRNWNKAVLYKIIGPPKPEADLAKLKASHPHNLTFLVKM